MAKTPKKAKEPIKLRFKELAGGNRSIYLDKYHKGKREYEFLKMYLLPDTTPLNKKLNAETLKAANNIKAQRIIELNNNEAGIKNAQRGKMKLFDYIDKYTTEAASYHRGGSFVSMLQCVRYQLANYLGSDAGNVVMNDITPDFCRYFIAHLKETTTTTGNSISPVTVYHYSRFFNDILNNAVQDDVIQVNPMSKLKKQELPKRPDTKKASLTIEEVRLLMTTDCKYDAVKGAFLFACFTGLRISDVIGLTWGSIKADGRLCVVMKKTQQPVEMLLSDIAQQQLPNMGNAKKADLIFTLPSIRLIELSLQRWADAAGIEKHITFHTARHTFATLSYAAGADLYTIQKLLGHKSLATTTVYADMIDKKKDSAITALDNLFNN